jgi:hypothetical protein
MLRRFRRAALLFAVVGLIAVAVVASSASPALAYGRANWQVAINGTATFPGTGTAFGFWGWCAFAGGVTSGNDGDCEFAQYFHAPSGSGFTCHLSLDVSSWDATGGTFVITGTASVNPTRLTGPCIDFFPGSSPYTGVDTGIPAAAGQYHPGVSALAPGAVGEFNITVAQIH